MADFLTKFLKSRWIAKLRVWARYAYLKIKYPGSDVYDVRDPRNFKASDILKMPAPTFAKFRDLFVDTNQAVMNQGQEPACTAIGTTLMKRIQDAEEHSRVLPHSWEFLWDKQGRPQNGDYLHRSLSVSVKNPFITRGQKYPWTGYAQLNEDGQTTEELIEIMKRWLMMRHPIKTGFSFKKGKFNVNGSVFGDNMTRAKYTGELILDEGTTDGGHDSTICGFDDEGVLTGTPGFIIYTCWGEWGKWKTGRMVLPYDQVGKLYSCFIGFDAIDLLD